MISLVLRGAFLSHLGYSLLRGVQMLALKIVKVDPHGEQAQFLLDSYANEIALLEKLKGNRFIIQLEDAEVG